MRKWPEILTFAALAIVLVGAIWLGNANSEPQANAAAATASDFAIRGARVFDGEHDLGVTTVVVRGGRIDAVGTELDLPPDLAVVDGSGKTLLPGLIDAHVHAFAGAREDMARLGVTSGVDLHGSEHVLPALRAARESGAGTQLADIWAAGNAVTVPGGHGTQFGVPMATLGPDDDVDAFIAARADAGADLIKLILEDLSAWGAPERLPTLSREQVRAATTAAHARDLTVVAHVSTQAAAHAALAAGVDGLAHIFIDAPADAGLVREMRSRDAFVIPTLAVVAAMADPAQAAQLAHDPALADWLSPAQHASLATRFPGVAPDPAWLEHALASVRRMHAAGVDILAGSDAPNPGTAHGASLHEELALLVRAGLSPMDALRAATSVPARRLGIPERGRIAPGMRADLLLVDGNPLADITATRAIAAAWKNGQPVEREPAAAPARSAAESPPADTRVSDFEGSDLDARFGLWAPTTDAMAGGASTVTLERVAGGAGGSSGAMRLRGEIRAGFVFPWAGAIFLPGSTPGQAVNLSAQRELVFHARGDGRTYTVMLFNDLESQGMPSMQSFPTGTDWAEVRLALRDFRGVDPAHVAGIAIVATQADGAFQLDVDDVALQ